MKTYVLRNLALAAAMVVGLIPSAPVPAGEPPQETQAPAEAVLAQAPEPSAALEEARGKLDKFLAEIQTIAPATEGSSSTPDLGVETDPAAPASTLEEALQRFEHSGFAPIVATPVSTVYPYGRSPAVVTCLPTRVCDLRLEQGETVDGLALGDPATWQLVELYEGPASALTPHVLLKPSKFGLATNLVVTTDRRVYHVELRSPAESAARRGDPSYDLSVGWWYPDQWAQRRRTAQQLEVATVAAREAALALPPSTEFDPATLNWNYEIDHPRRRSRRLGWVPSVVLDDGQRTLIRLPQGIEEVPAAFGLLGDGAYRPLNASPVRDGWMVIPTVTGEIHLVVGAGQRRQLLRLVNRSVRPSR